MLSQIYSDYAIVNKKLSQEFEQLKKMTVVTEFRKIFIQDYDFIIYRDYVVIGINMKFVNRRKILSHFSCVK